MKKRFALVLALCMVFSFAACTAEPSSNDNDDSPAGEEQVSYYQMYVDAREKTLNIKSCEANIYSRVVNEFDASTIYDEIYDQNLMISGLDTDNPTAMVQGQRIVESVAEDRVDDVLSYYADGWYYFYWKIWGYKSQRTFEEYPQMIDGLQDLPSELPEALFANPKLTEHVDGALSMTLTLDEATMETVCKDMIVQLVANDVWDGDLEQVFTKNGTIKITIADGMIRKFEISFGCDIDKQGFICMYTVTRSIEFVSWNQDVTITPFDDLDEFEEAN